MKIFTGFLGGMLLGYLLGIGVIEISVNEHKLKDAQDWTAEAASNVKDSAVELSQEIKQ